MSKAKPKTKTIKCSGSTLIFTSAGVLRPGTAVAVPVAEASRLLAKGQAVEVIKRRKKRSVKKDVDSDNGGGNGDIGAQQDFAEPLPTTEN